MRRWTTIFGILLIAVGVGFYFSQDGEKSLTALIPAIIGALFLVCAAIASTPGKYKHAMHAAALLSLIGLGGTVTAIPKLFAHAQGEAVERPMAVQGKGITAILCLAFLGLAINSFMSARRKRQMEEPGA